MATIAIQVRSLGGKPRSVEIEADIIGCFAVHSTYPFGNGDFQLTHVPTGYAYLSCVSEADARAAAAEILASGLDWERVKSLKNLTAAHKAQGKAMREKYEND